MARIQITLAPGTVNFIERMQAKTGIRSIAEVVRNALSLLNWVVNKKAEGWTIVAAREGDPICKEVCMPFFATVTPVDKDKNS